MEDIFFGDGTINSYPLGCLRQQFRPKANWKTRLLRHKEQEPWQYHKFAVDVNMQATTNKLRATKTAAGFAECRSRQARNEITQNIKNVQITAEICKHQTQEETNHQNSDREFASCRMQSAATNDHLQIRGRRCSRR